MSKLLVGADPELFVTRDGKPVSAYGLVAGTKYDPHPVNMGAVQVDGMALEFNIAPAKSMDEFVYNIETVMSELRKMVPKDYQFSIEPVAFFSKKHMAEQPEEAKVLGCDPDFNAYTTKMNPRPDQHPVMRTAAGHLHCGWTLEQDPWEADHYNYCCAFTKQMDFCVGLPSVILDEDKKRKEMYGMAGAFRPKPYGLEYRVASNWWLKDKKHMRLVYENTHLAFNKMEEGDFFTDTYGETTARDIINSNDKASAIDLCERAGIPFEI